MSAPSPIDPTRRFGGLADIYARHRPSYPDAALDRIVEFARLSAESLLVDVGAGTGRVALDLVRAGWEGTALDHDPLLLSELTRNAGKVLTHRELLQRVWGPDYSGENTYLRTFIRHLRRKLEPDPTRPRFLLNELGVGYFVPLPDAEEG